MVWPTEFDHKLSEYDAMELPGQQLAAAQAFSPLDHLLKINVQSPPPVIRLSNIMCTMGPSTEAVETIERMCEAGMNIARLEMSKKLRYADYVRSIRRAAANLTTKHGVPFPLSIAVDLCGSAIFTGTISDNYGGQAVLRQGDIIRLTTDEAYKDKSSPSTVYIDYPEVVEKIKRDDTILIDSEAVSLRVQMVSGSIITCVAERDCILESNKEVRIPGVELDMPVLTEQDKIDIEFAVQQQVDIVMVPSVTNATAMIQVRSMLGEKGKYIGLVAKVENMQGIQNLEEIAKYSDGILVGRFDLGIDLESKRLVLAQKNVTARCNRIGVPVIVAAHIMKSMQHYHAPTRAEILDAANCVLDGADGVMTMTETASGDNPATTVAVIADCMREAEACVWTRQYFRDLVDSTPYPCEPITGAALAAVLAAQRSLSAAIVVATTSGRSAKLVARYRPRCPVLAVTRYPTVARQIHLYRAVIPLIYEETPDPNWATDLDRRVQFGIRFGIKRGFIRLGDPVVLVTGWKQGAGFTNTMRIVYATDE